VDGQIGHDFTLAAFFENSAGPVTGAAATMTVTVTNQASGAVLTSGPPTENPPASGYYQYTIDAALLTSRMRLKAVWADPATELYAETYLAIGDMPSWARTRRDLRRRIASRLAGNDDRIWQERATGGTDTTAVIGALVIGGEHEYRGCWLWFGSGPNEGLERRVTASAAGTMTLTFAPAVGTAIVAGDRLEVYPSGLRPSRLNQAIDDAISDLGTSCLIEIDEQVLATDGQTREFALPSDVRYVYRVGLVSSHHQRFLGWYEPPDWELLPHQRLRLDRLGLGSADADPLDWGAAGGAVALPDGYIVRVLGLADIDPPLYDDSSVDIAPEAIVALAAYRLALQVPSLREVLPLWRQDADVARARASTRLPAGTREVPR
jgi:hypothetical protein